MKPKVLFLCTGNTARSQMAEALLRRHAGDRYDVHSAGLEPGVVNPFTVHVLQERGFDTRGLVAKGIKQYLGKVNFEYLITVCSRAEENCPIFPGVSRRLAWPFEDPAAFEGSDEQKLAKFREVLGQIDARIQGWLKEQAATV